jgi:tetratricopeptide (TPR) repeat protein
VSRVNRCFLVLAANLLFVPFVGAGLYPTDEKIPFSVRNDGNAAELSFGFDPPGQFNLLMDRLADLGDINPNRKVANPVRQEALNRIAKKQSDPNVARDPEQLAGLAADLIRTRQVDVAVNLLAPHSRSRTPDFRVLASLAHAHALRGEWTEAVRWHESARLDTDFPRELPGATPEQVGWLRKVEFDYYPRWLLIHKQEAERRLSPTEEDVFPLFPVQWVNEQGVYEPGKLAESERAKLPADAVAIVQQLLLWNRDDTRLYWLLGELYAANGRLREAEIIFDQCASEARLYSNRKILMEHRAAIKRAVELLPPQIAEEPVLIGSNERNPPTRQRESIEDLGVSRETMYLVGAVFAATTLVLLGLQFRVILRRMGYCGSGR